MSTASGQPPVIVPSDMLRTFADLLHQFPNVAQAIGGRILDVRVVLDANAIIQDARLVAKARNPTMRPTLEELMTSGVLRCYAPDSVRAEVDEHLPRHLAKFEDGARDRAQRLWERYQAKIEWVDEPVYGTATGRFPSLAERDPDDLPIAAVFHVSGADGIVTDDLDLRECPEVAHVSRQLLNLVREYARAKATAMTATTLPTMAVTGVLVLAVELVARIPERWRLVAMLVVGAIAVAAVVLMSPEARSAVKDAFAAWLDWTARAWPSVEVASQHEAAIALQLPESLERCPGPRVHYGNDRGSDTE